MGKFEGKRVVKVGPQGIIIETHRAVHLLDELLLSRQVHVPLAHCFDPQDILWKGGRTLDEGVYLMRCAPDAKDGLVCCLR